MEENFKEFRIHVLNENDILATLPSMVTRTGKVQLDDLKRNTIKMFHKLLEDGKIETREHLKIIGSYLYGILFNGEINTEFKRWYDEIKKQPDKYLRVVLEFELEARELATFPWEYLYYPDTNREKGFPIAAEGRLILTRHVPLSVLPESLKPHEKILRILIVVSQPRDLGEVVADEVIKSISDLREKIPHAIEIHQLLQPDERSFPDTVKNIKPHVLHFIGHGNWDKEHKRGELAFVNRTDERAEWIADEDFSDYFRDFQPRLIFLHACQGASSESYRGFSGIALQLVYSRIPAVVAMQYPVTNKAATQFANRFYECLGEGKPVDVAVQEGRLELGMYLQEKHFSSRAFGSPVAFLQSTEGIIIAEAEPEPESKTSIKPVTLTSKVKCPNPYCDANVAVDDIICGACNQLLDKCPSGHIILKKENKCTKCGYGYGKDVIAIPSKDDAAMKRPESKKTF